MEEGQTTLEGIEPAAPEKSEAAPIVGEIAEGIRTVQGSVVEFDKISAGIAAIEAAHPSDAVVDVTTPAGMRMAIAGRAAWRNPRIALGKARKAAKAPVLELGRKIDAFAGMVEEKLLVGEDHYDGLVKAEEARREAERLERLRVEEERITRHRDNIEDIANIAARAFGLSSLEIAEKLDLVTRLVIGPDFEEFQSAAINAKAAAIVRLNELLFAAQKSEAERAEAQRNKERLEQLEREVAERTKREAAETEARTVREANQSLHATELAGQIRAIERRAVDASAESLEALIMLLEGIQPPEDLGQFANIAIEARAAALENLRSRLADAIKREAERQARQALSELQRYRLRGEQANDPAEVDRLHTQVRQLTIDAATYGDLVDTAESVREAVLAFLLSRSLALQSTPATIAEPGTAEPAPTSINFIDSGMHGTAANPGSAQPAPAAEVAFTENAFDAPHAELAACRSALAEALQWMEGWIRAVSPTEQIPAHLERVALLRTRGGLAPPT